MLSFLKKIFGSKATEPAPAPYKVEAPKVSEFPFPSTKPAQAEKKTADKKPAEKKTADKKPAVKAKSARKPKTAK